MKFKVKFTRSNLFIFCLLLTYLKPYNAVLVSWLNSSYQVLKAFFTLVLVFMFIAKRGRLSRFTIRGGVFLVIWMFSMLYNTATLGENFQIILSIIGICLLMDYYRWSNKFLDDILKSVTVIAKVYFVLNTITVLTQRPLFGVIQISYLRYFLGGDNYWAFILIPLCGLIFFHDIHLKNKIAISTWVFAFMGFFDLAYQFSMTGMIAYGLYLSYMILLSFPAVRKLFKVRNVVIVGAILVFIATQLDVDQIFGNILSVIGKAGFNSRNVIWGLVIDAIKKKWLFGYGLITSEQINSYMLFGTDHAHNILLELLLLTGMAGTLAFIRWVYFAVIVKKKFYKDRGMQVLYGCIVAFLICSVFDFYPGLIYMYLFIGITAVYKHLIYKTDNLNTRLIRWY